jgi:hypothetical protein
MLYNRAFAVVEAKKVPRARRNARCIGAMCRG